jgi:transcriptional activator of cad operon
MDRPTAVPLRIGAWRVDPASGQISRGEEVVRLEGRTMRLLLCLAEHAGEVVSIDDLLDQVWSGVVVTQDSAYQGVASLRRLLGDDAKEPAYIATVPRLGYRMVAKVSPWVDDALAPTVPPAADVVAASIAPAAPAAAAAVAMSVGSVGSVGSAVSSAARRRKAVIAIAGIAALGLALVVALRVHTTGARPANSVTSEIASAVVPPRSVAVLPFLDLTTQEMNEEYFADGMTEELIGQLSNVPGLRVPAPTSSFYFKDKQATVADIAQSLGVAYVLDGSIRKSDTTLRVSARLVRAADGYVVWSETYDRPEGDKLTVQEDIASEVTKALLASLH